MQAEQTKDPAREVQHLARGQKSLRVTALYEMAETHKEQKDRERRQPLTLHLDLTWSRDLEGSKIFNSSAITLKNKEKDLRWITMNRGAGRGAG